MRIYKVFVLIFFLLLARDALYAQESRTEIRVDFRVNSTTIDRNFSKNAERLSEISSFLQKIEQDSTLSITEVSFCGSASPEGSYQLNRKLARSRLETLEKIIRSQVEIPDSIITRNDSYISWEFLKESVIKSDLAQKQAVLDIIALEPYLEDYPGGRHIDHRITKLQKLDGGKVWSQLLTLYFGRIRNACVVFVTYKKEFPPEPEPVIVPDTVIVEPEPVVEIVPDTTAVVEPVVPEVEEWTRRLYIKTNAIGLGMGIANIGAEIDLAKHWSFALPIYYSAWNYFKSTIKFRTFAVQPELRYWLSEMNDGLFAGAHFGLAYYNFAFNGDYRFQDHNRETPAVGGGLSLGYRLPISKDNRWRVEFSLGAGVYSNHYDKFHNTPRTKDGLIIESVKKTYWGIDQAAVSFSYSFDLMKKGGKR